MKNIIIILFCSLVVLASCSKNPLDITPDGRTTLADVFSDEKHTEAFVNTVYNSVPQYHFSYNYYSLMAGATDEARESFAGNGIGDFCELWNIGNVTSSFNPMADLFPTGRNTNRYAEFWAGIRNANIFLDEIQKVSFFKPERMNRLIGEVRILRAFYYLELIKQFGPMPVFDKTLDPGFNFAELTRPSFQDCVDFIVSDCDAAIANPDLPLRLVASNERGRVTKAVAYAIKSQALLYNASPLWNPTNDRAKWASAAEAGKQALTELTRNNEYKLSPLQQYEEYFLNAADLTTNPRDKETIFDIVGAVGGMNNVNGIPSKGAYKAGACPTQELVDSYDMQATGEPAILGYNDENHLSPIINPASGYDDNNPYVGRDPRFYLAIWHNGAKYDNIGGAIHTIQTFTGGADQLVKTAPNIQNTHTGYYLRKLVDSRIGIWEGQSFWKKFRLTEIYLNYAEAENEANDANSDVYAAINEIRRRAEMPDIPAGLSKDDMRKRIRNERRVEFTFEEHRFWDVRRWNILEKTDKTITGMEITKLTDGTFQHKRFFIEKRNAWQKKYLLFPIPISETSNMPKFAQNPDY